MIQRLKALIIAYETNITPYSELKFDKDTLDKAYIALMLVKPLKVDIKSYKFDHYLQTDLVK